MNKHTPDIEGIVEEFKTILKNQSIGDEPFQKSYELMHFQPLLIKWLRTTLQSQADRYEKEKGEMVREMLAGMGTTNINQHPVDVVIKIENNIKTIAQKYGVDLSK